MKILLTAFPGLGHVLPFGPLAQAALAAGHQVALLTSGELADAVRRELPGVTHLPAGPGAAVVAAHTRAATGHDPIAATDPSAVVDFFAGSRIDLTIDEALARAAEWEPDVVVAESLDTIGPMVASSRGLPWHELAVGPAVPAEIVHAMAVTARARYDERGLAPVTPSTYLDICPPLLQRPEWSSPARHQPLRPEPHRRGPVDPTSSADGVRPPVARPEGSPFRVLVTLGTVFSQAPALERLVRSADSWNAEVVLTTGSPAGEGSLPDRADGRLHVVPFAPMAELLDGVDAVVAAGGSGSLFAALSRGLPLVLWPQGADQPLNAALASAAGVALVVDDPDQVAAAVGAALHEPAWRAAATRAAAEIAAMPSAAEVVSTLFH